MPGRLRCRSDISLAVLDAGMRVPSLELSRDELSLASSSMAIAIPALNSTGGSSGVWHIWDQGQLISMFYD